MKQRYRQQWVSDNTQIPLFFAVFYLNVEMPYMFPQLIMLSFSVAQTRNLIDIFSNPGMKIMVKVKGKLKELLQILK